MISISDRLDAHDQHISQLQSSVSALQSSVESVRTVVADLKKLMVSLTAKLEKRPVNQVPLSPFPESGGVSDSIETAVPLSPKFEFSGNSSSKSELPWFEISRSGSDSDQLKAYLYRSEGISVDHGYLGRNGHSDSTQTEKKRDEEFGSGFRSCSLTALIADQQESGEFRRFVITWMKSQEKQNVDCSSGSRFSGEVFSGSDSRSDPFSVPKMDHVVDRSYDSPSLFTRLPETSSLSEAALLGAGDNLPRSDNASIQARLGLYVDKWATMVGLGVEQNPSSVVGQEVGQKMVLGLTCSLLDLCGTGKTPFDRGKDPPFHRPLDETRLTFSAMWNFWVVHGQPRPPFWVVPGKINGVNEKYQNDVILETSGVDLQGI